MIYNEDTKITQNNNYGLNGRDWFHEIRDFNEIFEFVKHTVSKVFKMNRTGLNLILQVMPSNLGAYHIMGSNIIVANRYLLEHIKNSRSNEEYNCYVFTLLVHEYLHSLGIVNEYQVRMMTKKLCLDLFGKNHITTKFAINPSSAFPDLQTLNKTIFEENFTQVKKFDDRNQYYIQ